MDLYQIDGHKIHLHPERIAQWHAANTMEKKLNVYPIYVEISPVGQCNHRCTFCAVDYLGYVNRKLETKRLVETIKEMGYLGVKSVMFAGEGEPMLHPDIVNIVYGTRLAGIDVGFTTNGSMMNTKFIRCLPSCTFIKVSMNGGTPDVYAAIHQVKPAMFKLVWDNIINAVEMKRKLELDVAIGVQAVLLPDNAHTMHDLAKKCWEVGVDYLVIKPYSHKEGSLTTKYKNITYYNQYNDVLEAAQQFESPSFHVIARRKTMEDWDDPNRGYSKCLATPYFWAYIMSTGDVFGCSAYLNDSRFSYGNINRQGFSNIWTGRKREESIRFVGDELDITECRKNCRMNKVNKYLDAVKNPSQHRNFI